MDPTLACVGAWLLLSLVAVVAHFAELGARAVGLIERDEEGGEPPASKIA